MVLGLVLSGCASSNSKQEEGPPQVVATTNIVADGLSRLLGGAAQVDTLMGPGVDPHLYKAGQSDLQRMAACDLIVYNGLHLEGKLTEVLDRYGQRKPTLAVAEQLPAGRRLAPENYAAAYDPHVWMDVDRWRQALMNTADTLATLMPQAADTLRRRAQVLDDTLRALDQWVEAQVAQIPAQQRVLITAHDAFRYFGDAYGIDVRGLQGISTTAEFGLKDVSQLVDFIIERQIRALFVETSVSPRAIEAVVEGCRKQGHRVRIGGKLYSDALGRAGSPEGRYPGMIRHNVRTIVDALTPSPKNAPTP
jgi:manganese/zinc/iron transport system substrate-binding protein